MMKDRNSSRRQFLRNSGKLVLGEALLSLAPASATTFPREPQSVSLKTVTRSQLNIAEFLFGASVYPELQTRDEWNRMLDDFQRAHMHVLFSSKWKVITVIY